MVQARLALDKGYWNAWGVWGVDLDLLWLLIDSKLMTHLTPFSSSACSPPTITEVRLL